VLACKISGPLVILNREFTRNRKNLRTIYRLNSQRYNKELNGAVSVARLAGSVMLHYYDLDYAVTEKPYEATPESAIFTEVDGKVDSIVQNYFRQVWPEDQLLTEETEPDERWYEAMRIWTIDPIDGTLGYKKKTGSFGISIALIEDGRPVLGVLYAPVHNLLAWAVIGEGAYLNGIKVELNEKTSINTILCSSNAINRPAYKRALEVIDQDHRFKIKSMESVVMKALLILHNDGEIYPILPKSEETKSFPKFWDIAAADILIHEAGGRVTTFSGETYRYNIPEFRCINGVLMGTRRGHELALRRLQSSS
jgi:myo-inositol-1(or 4)-monophosphatase